MDGTLRDLGLAWAKSQPKVVGGGLAILVVAAWLAYLAWKDSAGSAPWFAAASAAVVLVGGFFMASWAVGTAMELCRAEWRTDRFAYVRDGCEQYVHCQPSFVVQRSSCDGPAS